MSFYIGDSLAVSEAQFQLFDGAFKRLLKTLAFHNTIMNTLDQISKLIPSCHIH
jgi:hypothetical protein